MIGPRLALAAAIVCTAAAQTLLKSGSDRPPPPPLPVHPATLLGLATLLCVTGMNTYALTRLSLSTVTAWAALVYPLTLIAARWFLGERFALRSWLGLCLICAGIALYAAAHAS